MAKRKAKALSAFCRVLQDGIKAGKKDVSQDKKDIAAQERLIRRLIKTNAKPALIEQAQERLKMLKHKLETDEAQLSAFEDEFAADCRLYGRPAARTQAAPLADIEKEAPHRWYIRRQREATAERLGHLTARLQSCSHRSTRSNPDRTAESHRSVCRKRS
jgi:hypothetical protein